MSFILDALRKSEHERRIEAAPDIMRMPHAVPRSGVPLWAAAVIGALSAALLAITLYVVLAPGEVSAPPSAAAPPADTRAAEPQTPQGAATLEPGGRTAEESPPAPPMSAAQRSAARPAAEADTTADLQPGDESGALSADAVRPGPRAPAPAPADVTSLPSYAAVVADGMSLSPLQMQLHVHSAAAASRFVVINGSRYGQGERLAEGPVIEEIVAEGAILNFRGRQFLLTPN